MTGENGVSVIRTAPHSWCSFIRAVTSVCAATRRIGSASRSAASVAGSPAAAATAPVTEAASAGEKNVPGTDWAMARWNRPFAAGIASSAAITPAPADSPKTVTFAGSPPNCSMFSWTQRSAATASSRPRLAGAPGICAKPSVPRR